VAEEFEDDAARAREKFCYFHSGPRFASIIGASRQHSIASIGPMPYWNPMDSRSILHSDASLRYQISRARRKASRSKYRRRLPPKARNYARFAGNGSIASTCRRSTSMP